MAASQWLTHHAVKEYLGLKVLDMANDTFKCALATGASSLAHNPATDARATIPNEVATGNGYTAGGITLTGVTWQRTDGEVVWAADDPVWTAAGGSIMCRYSYIYDASVSSPVLEPVLFSTDLDATSVTATNGKTLRIDLGVIGVVVFGSTP